MLAGSLAAGPLANLMGRKWTSIIWTCTTLTLGYALIPMASHMWIVILARFIMGAALGFSTAISTLYIMEIATPALRATLAVVPAVAGTLGILTCQVLGAFLEWQWLSVALGALNLPWLVMLLFVPETPVYLIGTEQIERAHKVLRTLRGKQWDIKVAHERSAVDDQTKTRIGLRDFITPSVLKPFNITLVLMFFFQFSGINLIMQYTVDIFQAAESSINEFTATIIVGIVLLFSNVITLCVASKMPRRLMLLLSSLGVSLTMVALGVYFYLKTLEHEACQQPVTPGTLNVTASTTASPGMLPVAEKFLEKARDSVNSLSVGELTKETRTEPESEGLVDPIRPKLGGNSNCPAIYTEYLGWLPLLILMVYIFFFNLGFGAMIWITVAEILPQRVRSVTNSLAVGFCCLCSFLTSHTYPALFREIGGEGVFWLYGSISFLGFVFIFVFVPETKNKSERQIQAFFLSRAEREEAERAATSPGANVGSD